NKNNNSPYNNANYTFYYQLSNDEFYQITCQMISHSTIVQLLNDKVFGIKLRQSERHQQERLEISDRQKENLETHLKQYLFNYLTPKQINGKPFNGNFIYHKL